MDDANIMGENMNTITKNTVLFETNKEVGLEVNAEKTKYLFMLMFRYHNEEQNHNLKIGYK